MEALRIEIKIVGDRRVIHTVWRRGSETVREIPTGITESQIATVRYVTSKYLQKAKNALGSRLQPTWKQVDASAKLIRNLGYILLARLFPHNAPTVLQVWQDHLRPFLMSSASPPILTLIGPAGGLPGTESVNLLLPWEYLPLFAEIKGSGEPAPWESINSLDGLASALQVQVGYRCLIHRVLGDIGEIIPRKEQQPEDLPTEPVPAKFFTCRNLRGAVSEERVIRKIGRRRIAVDAWPRRRVKGTCEDLAKFLWRTTHRTTGHKRKYSDRIHHFATHFDASSDDPDEHILTFGGCERSEFQVTLMELQAEIGRWLAQQQLPDVENRPLVFMNACSTSVMNPNGITTLPSLFLGILRSSGYIGTETTVPDFAAREFAAEFYRALLEGASVGRALYDARRSLVYQYRNPLGMFYTCYAYPHLKIQFPSLS